MITVLLGDTPLYLPLEPDHGFQASLYLWNTDGLAIQD